MRETNIEIQGFSSFFKIYNLDVSMDIVLHYYESDNNIPLFVLSFAVVFFFFFLIYIDGLLLFRSLFFESSPSEASKIRRLFPVSR